MPKKEDIRLMFNDIAPKYDKLNRLLSLNIDINWRKAAIKRILENPNDMQVLDIACGTGDYSIDTMKALLKRKSNNSHIQAVDIAEDMLKIMREKCEKEGLSQYFTIAEGDGEALAFEDESFDVVTIGFGIRNFEHIDKGLSEMYRVLKKSGRLFILELSLPENPIVKAAYKLYFCNIAPIMGDLISGNRAAYEYLPNSVIKFPKRKEFTQMMHNAGFKRVEHKSMSMGACRMYIGYKE